MNSTLIDGVLPDESRQTVVGVIGLVFLAVAGWTTQDANKETDFGNIAREDMPEGYVTTDKKELAAIEEFEKNQRLPLIPWLIKNVRVAMSIYIIGAHLLAVNGISYLFTCKWQTILAILPFYLLSGFGITGINHRLYAHKSYQASAPYRWFGMFCQSMANQGSVMHWSRDHRTHHRYSETKADPHNALRGFFFAHVGWLILKKSPRVKFAGMKTIDMSDIENLPEVALQKKFDPLWNLFFCYGFPTIVGVLGWGEDAWSAFYVLGALRYIMVLNSTFLVNSAAHIFGGHPYDDHMSPAENPAVAILSLGEGWHNWHHTYPFDYAASELGISSQFNPTKLFIDLAATFGLVWGRRRATTQWESRQKRKNLKTGLKGAPMFRQRTVNMKSE